MAETFLVVFSQNFSVYDMQPHSFSAGLLTLGC